MEIIAVLNFKGGVGKTTLTACVAQALALTGAKVLVIDNDSQHNLSAMLGISVQKPNIRDVYLSSVGIGGRHLLDAIHKTIIPELDVVTSDIDLSNIDVKDPLQLKKCIDYCSLHKRYDYLLIDNSPGLDRLQEAALHACKKVFVPTELSHFSISGVYELHRKLVKKFPEDGQISKIIPYFYRPTKQQDSFIKALNSILPGRITAATVPYDPVFEKLVDQHKVLFLHRLSSPAAFSYIELLSDLFPLDAYEVLNSIMSRQKEWLSNQSQARLKQLQLRAAGKQPRPLDDIGIQQSKKVSDHPTDVASKS